MICLGNICRSPLAEGILKHLCIQNNLKWEVDSCGTGSWHLGNSPDKRSQMIALENGIDIADQKARQIKKSDLKKYDLLITMDADNYNMVKKLAEGEEVNKIYLLNNFAKPGRNESVTDPYFDDALFGSVFQQIYTACEAIIAKYS